MVLYTWTNVSQKPLTANFQVLKLFAVQIGISGLFFYVLKGGINMNLLDGLKKNSLTENTKGGKYYNTSYNANLDVFTMLSRYNPTDEIIRKFHNALEEDETLALANLLYILDIRSGKGERLIFTTIYRDLCLHYPSLALKILPFIGELGRYDYILLGLDTPIEDKVIELIKNQLKQDEESDSPSLLAKWLPSHRNHNENNMQAKLIMKKLGLSEKDYRKKLSHLRSKINIVEKNLTTRNYDSIDFEEVPTKAMLKYQAAFKKEMAEKYENYLKEVKEGNAKINTKGLFCYEIVKKIQKGYPVNAELLDAMWNNQKDVLNGIDKNILVVADTSGSMTVQDGLPLATSIGLAIYTAERNNGIFKNHFITFSSEPRLEEVRGKTIVDKVSNIETIIENTDIDKVFELILKTAKENHLKQEDMPEFIVLISDMEFDCGVHSSEGTNFNGWKKAFTEDGYQLPKIIFWNVAAYTQGIPVTKFENDVALISGFSTNLLSNLFQIENFSPEGSMLEQLESYIERLS